MQIKVSTRHGSISEATEAKIISKVEKLGRYFDRLTQIELTVDLERPDEPSIDINVSAEHKHDFVANYRSADMYGCVDQVIHKVEQQIKKYKEKLQNQHRHPKGSAEAALEPVSE